MHQRSFRQNDLFKLVPDDHLNACVGFNGGPYDLYDYAWGYFDATFLIFEGAHKPRAVIDVLVYPACYNFRHALELYVKYLVERLAKLLDEPKGYKLGHHMLDNWRQATALASKVGAEFFNPDDITLVGSTIENFCEVDPVGQIFRYPESIKQEMHLREWACINLRIVEQRLRDVVAILREGHYRVEGRLDNKLER